ncbi:thiamine-monophosphate kinase [Stenotrophomonas sp. AN71]|uniref:thiamine-phosphate kinase n=1 Tax=Stenotrophomonas sp. AN71 TaxID=3156253 RepID=UPI003D1CBF6A
MTEYESMLDIGEKGFIASLMPMLSDSDAFVNGFGHDVSIVDVGLDELIAFKIDRAPKPVLLALGYDEYRVWGRLAAVANISDIIAGGAVPYAVMLSLVLPRDFPAEYARQIVLGCRDACQEHGVNFVGGDTKEGREAQVVGAAIGRVSRGRYWARRKAVAGDRLYVTGTVGAAAAAMLELSRSEVKERDRFVSVLRNPCADVKIAAKLREKSMIFAACDISDGLCDAVELFSSGSVGVVIDADRLPLSCLAIETSTRLGVEAWKFAFSVGDWGLALVVSKEDCDEFEKIFCGENEVTRIGDFLEISSSEVRHRGRSLALPKIRNEHFRSRFEDGAEFLDFLVSPSILLP